MEDISKTTGMVEDFIVRAEALNEVAEAQARVEILNDALKTAESIEDADTKALAIAAIAKSLALAIKR